MAEEFENESVLPDNNDSGFEIEIVDDTPEPDRGKPPVALKEEEEDDEHGKEVESYSKKVQKRIDDLTFKANNERREKERLSREHEEAIRIAQAIRAENEQLKSTLTWGHQEYTKEASGRLDYAEQLAQDKYRRAFESGDTDGVLEAQRELNAVAIQKDQLTRFVPPVPQQTLQQPQSAVYSEQNVPQPQPTRDYKAEEWASKNPWFRQDEEMTAFAYGVHEKLVKSGVDPTSDEYYQKVDARMRETFPNNFQRTKKTSPVASVGRTTAPRKVTLSASEAAIAKKLGVTLEAYAKYKMKEQTVNG